MSNPEVDTQPPFEYMMTNRQKFILALQQKRDSVLLEAYLPSQLSDLAYLQTQIDELIKADRNK